MNHIGRFRFAFGSKRRAARAGQRHFNPAPRPGRGAFSRAGGNAAPARGFTLIEVLVAFSLLAIGLGILLAILSDGVHAIGNSTASTQATLYAQQILDNLGADRRLQPGRSQGDFDGGRYRWTLDVTPFPPPAAAQNDPYADATAQTDTDAIYRVRLSMRWGERGAERKLDVDTLRTCVTETAGAQ